MKLTQIRKTDYVNWEDYYWNYQFILAKEYYIPLLKEWGYNFSNTKILDIGCGNGGFTAAFGEYCNITGIDIKSFPWKNIKNVSYKTYDILSKPKKIDTDFDLIIMRDVIEHIPNKNKLDFIKTALNFGKPNSKLLITFPPFYSPFGLHQQVLLKSFIKYIPFLSSISPKVLIPILKVLNENSNSINNIKDMYNSKMTISNFESIMNELKLNISQSKFFYSRPSHEIRYKIKTKEVKHSPILLLKEYYILGTVYFINK